MRLPVLVNRWAFALLLCWIVALALINPWLLPLILVIAYMQGRAVDWMR